MNLKQLYTVLAILGVGVGVGFWASAVEQKVRDVQTIQDSLERNQGKIIDWMDKKLQEEKQREAERKVFEDLCKQGRLPAEDCQD
jgi:hypothetical protein